MILNNIYSYCKVSKKASVVSNGDCKETASFETGYNSGHVYYTGRATSGSIPDTPLSVSWSKSTDKLYIYMYIYKYTCI